MTETLILDRTAETTQTTDYDDQITNVNPLDGILTLKDKFNSDPDCSNVLIDPCEISYELVVSTCQNLENNACKLGVILQEGVAFCPLNEARRQVTLRSEFPSKTA